MTSTFSTNYAESFVLMNNGSVKWLNSDEVLINFENYCTIFRLAPFSLTVSEKWPYSATRLEVAKHCLSSILQTFRQNKGLKRVTVSNCRNEKNSRDWKIIHDLFTDPLITAEEAGAKATINHVSSLGSSTVMLTADGQLLLFARVDSVWTFVENLTNVLLNYLSASYQLLEQLKREAKAEESVCTEAATIALFYRRAAQFCSTKFWLWLTDDPKQSNTALSIQRDNSLIVWLSDKSFTEKGDLKIVDVKLAYFNENVTAAVCSWHHKLNCGFLLVGSNEGNVYWSCLEEANVSKVDASIKVGPSSILIDRHDDLKVYVLKVISQDENSYMLLAARESTILVVRCIINGHRLIASGHFVCRTRARFQILNILPFQRNEFFAYSRDAVMKYKFESDENNVRVTPVACEIINESESEVLGADLSPNCVFLSYCLRKRILDRYECKYPYSFNVLPLQSGDDIWNNCSTRDDVAMCGDYLVCLREVFLNSLSYKSILSSIDNLLNNIDTLSVCQLKAIRHAIHLIKPRLENSPEESLYWQNHYIAVERLLIADHAHRLVDRWKSMETSERKRLAEIAQSADYWLACNESKYKSLFKGNYKEHACPMCRLPLSEWSEDKCLEKSCKRKHRIPLCCITLTPITDFSYRKCSRCELLSCDTASFLPLIKVLLPNENICPFCDGFFTSIIYA